MDKDVQHAAGGHACALCPPSVAALPRTVLLESGVLIDSTCVSTLGQMPIGKQHSVDVNKADTEIGFAKSFVLHQRCFVAKTEVSNVGQTGRGSVVTNYVLL